MNRLDLELPGLDDELTTWTDDAVELLVVAIRYQVVKTFAFYEDEERFFEEPESAPEWAAEIDDWYLDNQEAPNAFERARGAAAVAHSFAPDVRRVIADLLYEAIHSGIEKSSIESTCQQLRRYQREGRRGVRAVGLWFTQADMTLPDPWWFIVDQVAEIPSGIAGWHWMGFSYCRLCGVKNGNAEFTDGAITWPEGLSHYIDQHAVRLPVARNEFNLALGDIEGIAADLFERDATWWRNITGKLVAFAESAALWSARQAATENVVLRATELLDYEMASFATAALAGTTTLEAKADMSESVRRACQELGIRFDSPESQEASESANRVRFARALRDEASGWDLLNELRFVVDTNQTHNYDRLQTLLGELETCLFVEREGGTPVGRAADRTEVEAEMKALSYRNLSAPPRAT